MQESGQNAPKTIHVRYPAPYGQPLPKAEARPSTPVIKRKRRVNSYSAQSGLNPEKKGGRQSLRPVSSPQAKALPPPLVRNRCSRKASTPLGPRPSRQHTGHRPDPSAPHLKYGLFRAPRKPWIAGNIKKMRLEAKSSYIVPKPDPTVLHLKYGMFRPPNRTTPLIFENVTNATTRARPAFKQPSRERFVKRKRVTHKQDLNEDTVPRSGVEVGTCSIVRGGEPRAPHLFPRALDKRPMLFPEHSEAMMSFRSPPRRSPQRLSTSKVHHLDIKPGRKYARSSFLPRVSFVQ